MVSKEHTNIITDILTKRLSVIYCENCTSFDKESWQCMNWGLGKEKAMYIAIEIIEALSV